MLKQKTEWRERFAPLAPSGVAAQGHAAGELARRLLARNDEHLARLTGVAANNLIVILGANDDLPWADGALYLGRDTDAPALLFPTTLELKMPAALLEEALLQRFTKLTAPVAVLPTATLVPLSGARQLARASLVAFLDSSNEEGAQR